MNATVTNVAGADGLIGAVQRCWASLFSPRVITYRASRGFAADPAMAVVVQLMIPAEQAGVAFTADPSTGALDRVVIEAAFGQGEVVVSGRVEPDTYVVEKDNLRVLLARGCGGAVGHISFDVPHFVMEQKMLRGIRDRASRTSTPGNPRTLSSAARPEAWSDSRWRATDAACRP
jgi:pyruvate,water dikinase